MNNVGNEEVKIDRRTANQQREFSDRRTSEQPMAQERQTTDRRKTNRRRQIDPTTCERDYSGDEIEFMQALDEYKRNNGRMFPTCSEILEVVRSLGYVRQTVQPDDLEPSQVAFGDDVAEIGDGDDAMPEATIVCEDN